MNSIDGALGKARKDVEEKNYSAALDEYSDISEGLHKDPGLLIEWARVYTYADRHEEAIRLFEEVRTNYPNRSDDILRELADQYKWSGKPNKAVALYKEGLKSNPDDLKMLLGLAQALFWDNRNKESMEIYDSILERRPTDLDALLGKADILIMQDKLEQADVYYRKVLAIDPQNLTALNSEAKILVWNGYYRDGILEYGEILSKYPKNPDALEGIAFALHWDGRDDEAMAKIEELLAVEPNRTEAKNLYNQIKNYQYPFVRTSGRFNSDSTPQTVTSGTLDSGLHLNYSTTIDGIYENQLLRKKGATDPTISANRVGFGLSKSFGDTYEVNTFMYETEFNKVDFNPYTTDTWFTFKPDDRWRFDLAYDRETFEDNDALTNKIITNSPSLSMDFKPNRFWLFNLKYKRSYYSDDNLQNQISSKVEFRLFHKPYVKLFYNYYYSSWAEPELSHGYFNPRSLFSHSLGVYSGVDITNRLFIDAKASGGYEFQSKADVQNKKSDHPTCYLASSLNYRLTDNWLISATGDYFTTWPDHGQRSYQKKGAYLNLKYNFEASRFIGLRDATRPSRTTGAN
ncbi:MAG: tetratricopeptide repeat protein [Candidatus Omnitrophica bacterium]|nr:tetratricopeptide repeat protein [Candidatus Omnitrophota bacterium]